MNHFVQLCIASNKLIVYEYHWNSGIVMYFLKLTNSLHSLIIFHIFVVERNI